MKHTKGEWNVIEYSIGGNDGYQVQFGNDGEAVTDFVYSEADAKLIAEAGTVANEER